MITYEVRVCIGQDNPEKRIAVKCHDTGVNLIVYLQVCRPGKWRDETEPYRIPAGSTAVIKVAKPDKTYCVCDGELVSGGILFHMKPETFTAAGVAHAEVSLFGADTRRITSATFDIHVPAECVCEGEKESESYVDVMGKQIQAAIDAAKTATDAADNATAAASHQPTISSAGTWLVWDAEHGEYVDTGVAAQGVCNSDAVLYTAQELTAAQQKQARTNIDVAGYNVINYLWPTEHSGREDMDIRALLDSGVYMGIVKNSTAFPSPGLVMLQGPMPGNVYTAVLLAKDGLTYTATFQYVRSTKSIAVLTPVAAASSKLISVKMTRSESGENVYTADRDIGDIDDAIQTGHMALVYTPDAAGLQNSVGLITSCVRTERGSPHFVTVLDCWDTVLSSSQWQVDLDGITWTGTNYVEYPPIDLVANLEMAMPKPVGKTDAMTQAVGMDKTGKLWTQPGSSGGSAETWEKIAEIIIPEGADEATSLTINKDFDGNPFRLVKARLCAKFPKYTGATTIPNFSFAELNGKTTGRVTPLAYTSVWPKVSASTITGMVYEIDVSGAQQIEHVIKSGNSGWPDDSSRDYVVYGVPNQTDTTWFADTLWAKPITSIGGASMLIYPGCRFVLYGVRA